MKLNSIVYLATIVACLFLSSCGSDRAAPYTGGITCSSSSSSSSSSNSSASSSSSTSSSSSCGSSSSSSSSKSSSSLSSSSSSSAVSVALTTLWTGTQTASSIATKERKGVVIKDVTTFNTYFKNYANVEWQTPDFDVGQVILVDGGEIDSCKSHLEFNTKNATAIEEGVSSLRVTLTFTQFDAQTNCTPNTSHPYTFFYVKSIREILFSEVIK